MTAERVQFHSLLSMEKKPVMNSGLYRALQKKKLHLGHRDLQGSIFYAWEPVFTSKLIYIHKTSQYHWIDREEVIC